MMKWRIAKSKLMFMRKMILKEEDNICRRALMNETILGANGLSKECKDLAEQIGLQDPSKQQGVDESESKTSERGQSEPQKIPPQRPVLQHLKRSHGRVPRTPGGVPWVRVQENKGIHEKLEGTTDILEKDDCQDQ